MVFDTKLLHFGFANKPVAIMDQVDGVHFIFSLILTTIAIRADETANLSRNGIFVAPIHTLTLDTVPVKHHQRGNLGDPSPKGLLNATRSRVKRLVLLPKDDSQLTKPICSDDYCLESDYDRLKRPDPEDGGPIRVTVEMEDMRIIEVDDSTFSVSVQMYLGIRWTEPRIHSKSGNATKGDYVYDEAQYLDNEYEYETFSPVDTKFVRHLWVPDIYVYHMKYGSRMLKDFDGRLLLLNDQEVFYRQELIVTVWCPLRFEFYPMDHQSCEFRLGSYSLTNQEMQFQLIALELDKKRTNPVLEYTFIEPFYEDRSIVSAKGNFSITGFRMRLKRRSFQYIVNFYLPSVLFVVVSWTSFLIPPDLIPGRMTLLVTLFLVLINIFNTVNRKSPKVEGITSLAAFVIVCILFVFGALFAYAFILHKKKKRGLKTGDWRNGSMTIAHLFPMPSLVPSIGSNGPKEAWSSNRSSQDISERSTNSTEPSVKSPWPDQGDMPPPPSPIPNIHGAVPINSISKRVSLVEPLPGPRNSISLLTNAILLARPEMKGDKKPGAGWFDKEMNSMDGMMIIIFPMSFLLFNFIYWPLLVLNPQSQFN